MIVHTSLAFELARCLTLSAKPRFSIGAVLLLQENRLLFILFLLRNHRSLRWKCDKIGTAFIRQLSLKGIKLEYIVNLLIEVMRSHGNGGKTEENIWGLVP